MDGRTRRTAIIHSLTTSNKPISASALAKKMNVSRQVIVGDVALIRAAQELDIIATSRGYMLEVTKDGLVKTIVCKHTPEEMEKELRIITSLGGEVLDVSVEHSIYGTLTGNLRLKTAEDIAIFLDKLLSSNSQPLSSVTNGIHSHRVFVPNESQFEEIVSKLREIGILFE